MTQEADVLVFCLFVFSFQMMTDFENKTPTVGIGRNQISAWDDLLNRFNNELLEDEKQRILLYYKSNGYIKDDLEYIGSNFCDVVNKGMYSMP